MSLSSVIMTLSHTFQYNKINDLLSPVGELHHEVEDGKHHHKVEECVAVGDGFFLIISVVELQLALAVLIIIVIIIITICVHIIYTIP